MNKHIRDCRRVCEEAGLAVERVEHRGRHMAIHTSAGMLTFPCTPSDHRWRRNMLSVARRLLTEC